jgi:dTDP-4-dehydrorhamnose 3,5-epimerase-like enzyme
MVNLFSHINLKYIFDNESNLTIMNNFDELSFIPKRLFFINNLSPFSVRGAHAHKTCSQLIFVLRGEVKIELDNFYIKSNIVLSPQSGAIQVPPMVWATQTYNEPDSMLCVLASEAFSEEEYIRNYSEFEVECEILRND